MLDPQAFFSFNRTGMSVASRFAIFCAGDYNCAFSVNGLDYWLIHTVALWAGLVQLNQLAKDIRRGRAFPLYPMAFQFAP